MKSTFLRKKASKNTTDSLSEIYFFNLCNYFYSIAEDYFAAFIRFHFNLIESDVPKLLQKTRLLTIKVLQVHDEVCKNPLIFPILNLIVQLIISFLFQIRS